MRESIFYSSMRSLFVTLFGMIGIILSLFLFIVLLSSITTTTEGIPDITYTYTPEIVPNAQGIRKSLSKDAPVILKINIHGIIGMETLSHATIEKLLIESRERSLKDSRVKAIILSINSPGGTVFDADGIYQSIKHYKEKYKVPVYAHIDGLCASGGMYVAAAADKVFATDVSIVGSVGVISPSFPNFSQLLDKIGVQTLTLYAGKGKDDLNPLRPWKSGEEDNYKQLINYYYMQFVNLVTENRPQLDKNKLINDYGASIYPAKEAQEKGFIDESSRSYNETLSLLAHKIGIEDDYYQVIELESKTWFSELFNGKNPLLKGKINHQLELCPEMHPKLMDQFLYLYRP